MLRHGDISVFKAALGGVSALLLFSSAIPASAEDQPTATVVPASDPASGIVISGNTVMMAPIPDKAPRHAHAVISAPAAAVSAPVDTSISLTERPAIIIQDGTVTMAPIPDQAPIAALSADAGQPGDAKTCLARAIYFEARGESVRGQEAVAQVVLSRVKAPDRPKTICGVVYEGSNLSTGCQFSFTCDGISDVVRDEGAWSRALRIASRAMLGKFKRVARGALYYHANYVRPYWASHMVKVATIGTHIFYRP